MLLTRFGGVLCVIAIGVLAPAGCASAPSSSAPSSSGPSAETWMNRLCGAVKPVADAGKTPPVVTIEDAEATRSSFRQYFQQLARLDTKALAALDQLGPSPISGGDQLVANLRAVLHAGEQDFAKLATMIDQTPSDPSALASVLATAAADTTAANSSSFDKLADELTPGSALADAATRAPNCKSGH